MGLPAHANGYAAYGGPRPTVVRALARARLNLHQCCWESIEWRRFMYGVALMLGCFMSVSCVVV